MSSLDPYPLPPLLPDVEFQTLPVLRKLASTHRYLAELKGTAKTMPNQGILIDILTLQEAKDSSGIENIVTTHDELYKSHVSGKTHRNPAVKEVNDYAVALKQGFDLVAESGMLTVNHLLRVHAILEGNDAGIRRQSGTVLRNEQSGEVVFTPHQEHDAIVALLSNLERYMNAPEDWDVDPLIKMTVFHYQFESIHPFYDGNGRAGRILNILYLVLEGLLEIPVLYLSRYIVRHKSAYYRLLQGVRERGEWEAWVLYMLDGVEQTSKRTIVLITEIRALMQEYKRRMRTELPKIYRRDLLDNLFRHPYTKIELVEKELKVSRITATKYLELLVERGFVSKRRQGRNNYYINEPLVALLVV